MASVVNNTSSASVSAAEAASRASSVFAAATADEAARRRVRWVVSEHYDFVWRSLRRLGVPESSADDEAQQVFCVFAKRVASVAVEKEKSFLFGVVMRVAQASRRTRARRRDAPMPASFDDVAESIPSKDQAADEMLDEQRARAVLDAILDELPIDLRAVFVLYELEELTMAEIAQVLDVPSGTVASRLRRARERFELLAASASASASSEGAAR